MMTRYLLKGIFFMFVMSTIVGCDSCSNTKSDIVGCDSCFNTNLDVSLRQYNNPNLVVNETGNTITIFVNNIEKIDSFDCHDVIGEAYFFGDTLDIKANKYSVVKAEKVVCLYPTIWSSEDDNLLQFEYLFNFEYRHIEQLPIVNGKVVYPHQRYANGVNYVNTNDYKKNFNSITREQVLSSIDSIPVYEKIKNCGFDEHLSWNKEKKGWRRIASKYNNGDFTNSENETFCVDPYEIYLVLTFKGEKGTIKKVFYDHAIIGN